MMKKNDGFSLLELVVGIFCAALITGAAMSLLLMGARTNRVLNFSNREVANVRIITSMVDSLASEGGIKTVEVKGELSQLEDAGKRDWALWGDSADPILSYNFDDKAIYTQGGSVLMEDVISSSITLSKNTLNGSLLGFSIQTEDNYYRTSVLCRTSDIQTSGIVLDQDNVSIQVQKPSDDPDEPAITDTVRPELTADSGRYKLLQVLCTQYGSTGYIMPPFGDGVSKSFSRWYWDEYSEWKGLDPWGTAGWHDATPWCASFLVWGMAQIGPNFFDRPLPDSATVQTWVDYFKKSEINTWSNRMDAAGNVTIPEAGDVVVFDWRDNGYNDVEHIGVVFSVHVDPSDLSTAYIYTIEGNNSERVEINRYPLNSADIKGYGVLPWKTTEPAPGP